MSGRAMILAGVAVVALLGGAAGVAGLLRAGGDHASGPGASAGITETTRSPARPDGAGEHWTPERMRDAAPAPMPEGREP
ncbi:hypothetical protein ABT336_09630 [Micromonospora sp. NPDC000207]|uniref:hypothetical protein n=1 Tax=Micromonospora sp. NPDC000207 TaxID=3154246 RepID=UPI0033209790